MAAHFPELKYIDLGSGFKVPYQPGEKETDVNLLGEKVTKAFMQYENETGKKMQVWIEPGKFYSQHRYRKWNTSTVLDQWVDILPSESLKQT